MSRLVICEKPSVARSIAAAIGTGNRNNGYFEGNGYIVSWCYGHLVTLMLPDDYGEKWSGSWSFSQLPMLPDPWQFKVTDSGKEQFRILKKLINESSVTDVICATDADREGECIFRYVYRLAGGKKPVYRLWISSLEERVIRNGFSSLKPGKDYDSLYAAGFSRAQADWLIGMNASRLFSCRYNSNISIGRVQIPTLNLIVSRDAEAAEFKKQKYFTVDIVLPGFKACTERMDSESEADELSERCRGKNAEVIKLESLNKSDSPPKLYDLTSLQRDANRILGYTAQQTLDYLQSLYEGRLTTYPRTSSQYISDDMRETAVSVCEKVRQVFNVMNYPGDLNTDRIINNSKVDGHHAIIPTVKIESADIGGLPEGQRNILVLIAARLICACAGEHTFRSDKVTLRCENAEFTASGKTVLNNGWKDIYSEMLDTIRAGRADTDEEKVSVLPDLREGDVFRNISSEKAEHFTSPPKLYTEESLLSAMKNAGNENYDENIEKKGLGTPATRAGIIESLVNRGYIRREGKKLISTEKGRHVILSVPDEIRSPKMTADWEMKLKKIEKGSYSSADFLNEIKEFVRHLCEEYSSKAEKPLSESVAYGSCPVCGKDIAGGKFGLYCSGKCGMQISKVYGISLQEDQIRKLLSGKNVSVSSKGKKILVKPSYESYLYTKDDGKTSSGYQWCTERK